MRQRAGEARTRRDFLKLAGAAAGAALLGAGTVQAEEMTLRLPLGLQLYSVRELLPKNYDGTLAQIAALGYREVEAAGFYHYTAAQVKASMQKAGLMCVSAHYGYDDLHTKLDEILAFNHELGAENIVCASPGHKDRNVPRGGQGPKFTLEEWRWNAGEFNKIGAKVKAAGMRFAYHNHTMEFRSEDGIVPYRELLRLTDPSVVSFEMDCGWVVVGGADPVELLQKYPRRISMLHVKNFKSTGKPHSMDNPPPSAELGQGMIDYAPIFAAAAKTGYVRHAFVEQEEFDMAPMAALKIDAEYMKKLDA